MRGITTKSDGHQEDGFRPHRQAHLRHARPLGVQALAARRVSGLGTGLTWGLALAECALQQVIAHAPKSSQLLYITP